MAASAFQYLGNIYIWEVSNAYRREVVHVLEMMRTTQAARTLMKHINGKSNFMLILPFQPTKKDPVNAYAYPTSATASDAYPKGYVADTFPLEVPLLGTINIPTRLGTGAGSIVQLDFHPATYRQVIKNKGYIAPGDGPGEVLFHEMLHGLRMMSGLLRNDPMPGMKRMDDVEEFRSIMAQNVYRSERGFTSLRADHWGHNKLAPELSNSEPYYHTFKSEIDKWFGEQRAFCLDMAASPAKFNPFAAAAVELKLMPGGAVRVVSK